MQLRRLRYPMTKGTPKDAWWKTASGNKKCDGKNCYSRKGALKMKEGRMKVESKPLETYHCPKCLYWHLTSHLKTHRKRYADPINLPIFIKK